MFTPTSTSCQITVAPPYEACTSLHHNDAAALRVKKVVSGGRGGQTVWRY